MSEQNDIVKKIKPGQAGSKKLYEQYGKRLLCVRYRYDSKRNKKYKTVELIVDESRWMKNDERIPANKIVYLRVKYGEVATGRLIRKAGGKWNKKLKLWELAYQQVQMLGLEGRIVRKDSRFKEVQNRKSNKKNY